MSTCLKQELYKQYSREMLCFFLTPGLPSITADWHVRESCVNVCICTLNPLLRDPLNKGHGTFDVPIISSVVPTGS